MSAPASPLELMRSRVLPAWIDYNNHLNVGYYAVAFDQATDVLLEHLALGEAYRRSTGRSTFVLESHVTYQRELKLDDPLRFTAQLIDADAKRLHYFLRMFHGEAGWLGATNEIVKLHVDLGADSGGPRAAPFPPEVAARVQALLAEHRALPPPPELGRRPGLGPRR